MNIFIKIASGVLIAAVLSLILSKQCKDISVLLILAVCCIAFTTAIRHIEPVIELLHRLNNLADLDADMFRILLKSVGIGIIAEVVSLVCTDAGSATLGKTIQIVAATTILYLSTPLFNKLIELIEDILSAI